MTLEKPAIKELSGFHWVHASVRQDTLLLLDRTHRDFPTSLKSEVWARGLLNFILGKKDLDHQIGKT